MSHAAELGGIQKDQHHWEPLICSIAFKSHPRELRGQGSLVQTKTCGDLIDTWPNPDTSLHPLLSQPTLASLSHEVIFAQELSISGLFSQSMINAQLSKSSLKRSLFLTLETTKSLRELPESVFCLFVVSSTWVPLSVLRLNYLITID